MILVTQIAAHEYKSDVLSREARSNKRNVLCDGIVLAVAASGRKSFKWRTPAIWNTPLNENYSGRGFESLPPLPIVRPSAPSCDTARHAFAGWSRSSASYCIFPHSNRHDASRRVLCPLRGSKTDLAGTTAPGAKQPFVAKQHLVTGRLAKFPVIRRKIPVLRKIFPC
jgi:hypothetical protein